MSSVICDAQTSRAVACCAAFCIAASRKRAVVGAEVEAGHAAVAEVADVHVAGLLDRR